MAEQPTSLCRVGESNWRTYRDVRLASLLDTPSAFSSTYAGESAFTDERWLARVHSGSSTWLAMWGDLPVGTATSFRFPEQGEAETCLVGMWVAGHARGRGVGEALVGHVIADARSRGLARVTLDVAEANHPARDLYERMGFRPTGRRGVLPHDESIVELEMALEL
ncbi:N-acetyltransferase [Knoellia sp. p5-6-4]|uniref:GNAT family N-acetyltransferase n=1 Tax=unclassified Knoellia TaxID=2618719 RepID=UPI0023DAE57F|nr:GNAT family N-acetyltransferase [Knoellia sp. p5-6-4]MDF2144574.1 GNAT family N-acetyltransferase [Knoellia sp. p5-6-4]